MFRRNVVILGASCFIGKNLCRYLVEEEYCVTAVVRKKTFGTQLPIREICCDILYNGQKLKDEIDACDVCIMLCWEGAHKELRNAEDVNIHSATELFHVFKNLSLKFPKALWIQVGSAAEYGLHYGIVNERTETIPISAYGKGKLQFHNRASKYALENGITYAELRLHSIFGLGDSQNKMINRVVCDLSRGFSVEMKSSCTQIWNFLSINSFCKIVKCFIERTDVNSGVYNVGSEKSYVLRDYLQVVQDLCCRNDAFIKYGNVKDELAYDFVFDCRKLWNALGEKPTDDFKETVIKMREEINNNYFGCNILA